MNEVIAISAGVAVTTDNFEGLVREELGRIGEGFLRLGYYFEQANNCRLYESLGYDSIFELAEDLFDFKQSSVYDMMAVWRRFHSVKNPLMLREDCKGLKYSQLVECLRDKMGGGVVARVISAADTVKETRAKVTAWNYLVPKISAYPSLEEVENEVERQKMRKEREEAERENSRRLEKTVPQYPGQLPGQTYLFEEEEAEAEEENSRRLEFSEEDPPEETGQNSRRLEKIEGSTSPIGGAETDQKPDYEEENSRHLENPDEKKFQTSGKIDDLKSAKAELDALDDSGAMEKYAAELVKDQRGRSNGLTVDEIVPADIQMRVNKNHIVNYLSVLEMSKTTEGVEHFFEVILNRLVAFRAYKLVHLKREGEK